MAAPDNNRNAAKQTRLITDTLRRVVTQNKTKVRNACEALLDKAVEGDIASFREITDRLDGKVPQSTEISGPSGGPINAKVSIEFVN